MATARPIHIALLGDSVFDNAAYVSRGTEVIEQLRAVLPDGAAATLLAVDGAVIDDVRRQLRGLSVEVTHIAISAGGNDAIRASGVLRESARSVAEAVERIAGVRDAFAQRYHMLLDEAVASGLPVIISTIYEARFPSPMETRVAATALAVLNDVITRAASGRGLPLLDLRVLFSDAADYANAIEPSAQGGKKIAVALTQLLRLG